MREGSEGSLGGFIVVIILLFVIAVLLLGLLVVGIFLVVEQNPKAPASAYSFVKAHEIIGSTDGSVSDYQVKLVVHRGNGTDIGQDVYLNGHSQSWPGDIRFTDNSGSPLSYWVESYDHDMATVWVKVDRIPAAPDTATIKLYYGRAGDPGASNGNYTFIFFDNFSGSDYADKWQPGAGSWAESGGMLSRTTASSDGSLYVKDRTIGNGAIRCRYRQTYDASVDNPSGGIIARASGIGNPDDGYQFEVNRLSDNFFRITRINGWTSVAIQAEPIKLNQWYVLDAMMYDDTFRMAVDGTPVSGNNTAISSGKYGVRLWDSMGDYDWYLVRNYTLNEPRHGAWGDEAAS